MTSQTTLSWISIGLAALIASGCTVDAGDSLFLLHNKALDESCNVPVEKEALFLSRGLLDAQYGFAYTFSPLVESRTRTIDENDPLERAILIEGAEIELELPDGVSVAADATRFTQRFSGTLEPGTLSAFSFDIIPSVVTQAVGNVLQVGERTQILAKIKIFGKLGNGTVESPQFTYPVQVCNGCIPVQLCANYKLPPKMLCLPGQDGFEPNCCIDAAGALICPVPPGAGTDPEM